MYICICNKVTDKDIRTLVDNGICNIEEIRKITNAGNQCGKCTHTLKEVVIEMKEEKELLISLSQL